MTVAFNRKSEKQVRRHLRKNMPQAEAVLWSRLRRKGVEGFKFRRKYSVENFVLDFYCPGLKLAIEVDGDSHFAVGAQERDLTRQEAIESYGIKVLRFTNTDVFENLDGVMERILEHARPPLSPLLVKEGK